MRAANVWALLAGLVFVSGSGCASQKMERQVRDARRQAAIADQRTAELEVRLRGMEASMVFQQSMLGRAMAKQDATDRAVASLADGRGAPAATAQTAAAPAPPVAKELVDMSGKAVVVGADDATVRDILTKVEAYMGRPLTPNERQTLGQVLRRPRVIDTTNPWGPNVFGDR